MAGTRSPIHRGPARPGPKPRPELVLRDAAIEYCAALEAGDDTVAEWDRLRKAAERYVTAEKRRGRPARSRTA